MTYRMQVRLPGDEESHLWEFTEATRDFRAEPVKCPRCGEKRNADNPFPCPVCGWEPAKKDFATEERQATVANSQVNWMAALEMCICIVSAIAVIALAVYLS